MVDTLWRRIFLDGYGADNHLRFHGLVLVVGPLLHVLIQRAVLVSFDQRLCHKMVEGWVGPHEGTSVHGVCQ